MHTSWHNEASGRRLLAGRCHCCHGRMPTALADLPNHPSEAARHPIRQLTSRESSRLQRSLRWASCELLVRAEWAGTGVGAAVNGCRYRHVEQRKSAGLPPTGAAGRTASGPCNSLRHSGRVLGTSRSPHRRELRLAPSLAAKRPRPAAGSTLLTRSVCPRGARGSINDRPGPPAADDHGPSSEPHRNCNLTPAMRPADTVADSEPGSADRSRRRRAIPRLVFPRPSRVVPGGDRR